MRPPDPLQLLWIADQLEQIRELQEFVNPPSLQGAYARHVSGSVGLTDGSRPDAEVPRITNHLELLEQRISHDFEAARAQQARIHALQASAALSHACPHIVQAALVNEKFIHLDQQHAREPAQA